jgi:tetratricopeptide (TPR) repeat protein
VIRDDGGGRVRVIGSKAECIVEFCDPLTPRDQEEMKWYLEEFRFFPYGGDRWRAEQIQRRLAAAGEQIFHQLFDGPGASVFHAEASTGLEQLDIAIRSNAPRFLSIPWELICSPDKRTGYLASRGTSIYRQRVLDCEPEGLVDLADKPLRMLLVICRPDGTANIPLGSIAEPILAAARPLLGLIEVEVLRPPTFEQFCQALRGTKRYHLVHFDGHGTFVQHAHEFQHFVADKGYVLFESANHQCDPVSSDQLASAIPKERPPIFLLNACRSAREGDLDPFASVASQLLLAGCPCVLAMSYSVYVGTAVRFMASFYRTLLGGSSLVVSTTYGRNAIRDFAKEEEARLGCVVEDWIVPAAYVQRPETLLRNATVGPSKRHFTVARTRANSVARHEDMLKIERALVDRSRPVVFLSGVIGEGKTELARGFVGWWLETGGCEEARYVDSRGESDIEAALTSLAGEENYTTSNEGSAAAVIAQLKNTAILIVWDHPEVIFSDEANRRNNQDVLIRLFKSLEDAKGRLLVVTRQDCQEWLPETCQRVTIGDLPNEVVGHCLVEAVADHGGAQRLRSEAGLTKLIHAIGWHAETLNSATRALATNPAGELGERLEYGIPRASDDLINPIIDRSFEALSPNARMALPLLGLFGKVVFPRTLGIFTGGGTKELVYRHVFGFSLCWQEWQVVLEEAALVGLVRGKLDQSLFELPTIVRYYLRGRLHQRVGDNMKVLRDAICSFYASLAAVWGPNVVQRESGAVNVTLVEEDSFLLALHYAMQSGLWAHADGILRLFHVRYEDERDILLGIIGDVRQFLGAGFPSDNAELHLWCTIQLIEADSAEASQDFTRMEKTIADVLSRTERVSGTEFLPDIATCIQHLGHLAVKNMDYKGAVSHFQRLKSIAERTGDKGVLATALHGLGIVAQSQYETDVAEELFNQALAIHEASGDVVGACSQYHHLGMISKVRGQYDKAEDWFLRALRNRERLNLLRNAASDRFLLGEVAECRGDLAESRRWFREALQNYVDLGLDADSASAAHRLAMVLEQQGEFEEASQWCRWTLGILRHLRKGLLEGHAYHELGIIALQRNELQDARDEFQRALGIYERLGSVEHMAGAYHMLGSVARAENNLSMAKGEFIRALEAYTSLNHPPLLQKPLLALGELAILENDDGQAIKRIGQALQITKKWNLGDEDRALGLLAQILDRLGYRQFQAFWTCAGLGVPPSQEAVRAVRNPGSGSI